MREVYDYTIYPEANNVKFQQICQDVEKIFNTFNKEKLLIDVDGSLIQTYWVKGKKVNVFNDYEVDAVYIKSDIELMGLKDKIWEVL